MSEVFRVVAVVDDGKQGPVVWWVNAGSKYAAMSRMCGAWHLTTSDLREQLPSLVEGYSVVATSPGSRLLVSSKIAIKQSIDLASTRVAVSETVDRLQAAYEHATTSRKGGKSLIAPAWPKVPEPLDIDSPTPTSARSPTARAFDIACWLALLCERWDTIESQRISRTYLRAFGGDIARPLPLALSERTPRG